MHTKVAPQPQEPSSPPRTIPREVLVGTLCLFLSAVALILVVVLVREEPPTFAPAL